MDKIKVRTKSSYGNRYYFPECDLSRLLASFRNRESLNLENVKAVKNLGYEVEYLGERDKDLDALGAKYITE